MKPIFTLGIALSLSAMRVNAAYNVARDYSGSGFFAEWDFYGNYDNLTSGDANYLDLGDATSQNLAYVTAQNTAIVKVDNTTNVPYNDKRNSIRITSKDSYPVGSLWIIDAKHMPYGCSVWPSVWTTGEPWPTYGEIDIIEGVNLVTNNQMAIHSAPGCTKTTPSIQTGQSGATDCSQGAGCVVAEKQANSFGAGFASAGGGVFAAQFDATGIYIWFWSRANVPQSIQQATTSSAMDISSWGNPSAAYPSSSCNIGQYFGSQKLVVDITLCGDWAGVPATYNATCSNTGPTGQCTADNVFGIGSKYDNAYFEFNYIRGYTLDGVSISQTTALNYSLPGAAGSAAGSSTATSSSVAGSSPSSKPSSADLSLKTPTALLFTFFVGFLGFLVI